MVLYGAQAVRQARPRIGRRLSLYRCKLRLRPWVKRVKSLMPTMVFFGGSMFHSNLMGRRTLGHGSCILNSLFKGGVMSCGLKIRSEEGSCREMYVESRG